MCRAMHLGWSLQRRFQNSCKTTPRCTRWTCPEISSRKRAHRLCKVHWLRTETYGRYHCGRTISTKNWKGTLKKMCTNAKWVFPNLWILKPCPSLAFDVLKGV